MFSWIGANLSTILISIVLIAIVTFISLSLIRQKRQGKSSCGGNCARCAGSCGAANHETVTADRAEREAKLAAEKAAAKQAAVKAARDAQPAASDSDRKGDNA